MGDPNEYAPAGPRILNDDGVIKSFVEENGSIRNTPQDQTSPPLDLYFTQAIGVPTALTNAVAIDDTLMTVDSVADISVGNYVGVFSGTDGEGRFYFGTVLTVGTPGANDVVLDTPFDFAFDAADPVISTTRDLNVDGSTTPQAFTIRVGGVTSPVTIDLTGFKITMFDGTAMDDSLFGSRVALPNGLILRRVDGDTRNIFNAHTNGELALLASDSEYPDKVPSGKFAFRADYTLNGLNNHGVVLRIETGEEVQLIVQDDLTDIDEIRAITRGQVVIP